MTTFPITIESEEPLRPGHLAYYRARLSNRLHELVLTRFIEAEKEFGLTKADLARRIGRKPEQVTRWLGSPGNWTIETVSDLLLAMGCELEAEVASLREVQRKLAEQCGVVSLFYTPIGSADQSNSPFATVIASGQHAWVSQLPLVDSGSVNASDTLPLWNSPKTAGYNDSNRIFSDGNRRLGTTGNSPSDGPNIQNIRA